MTARIVWSRAAQLLYVIGFLAVLLAADRWLVAACGSRSETSFLNTQLQRATGKPGAKIVVLGQSTMGQWLGPNYLARALRLRPRDVLDGHLGGCHQDCTWAEVQLLLHQGRHFKRAFFGLNLYEMCDSATWKRSLQHATMTPMVALPSLFEIYLESKNPVRFVGRFLGASLSRAYADPLSIQENLRRVFLGKEAAVADWTSQPETSDEQRGNNKREHQIASCSMTEPATRVKRTFTDALLSSMEKLADRNYFLLLPDRSANMRGVNRERWQLYRAMIAKIMAKHPKIKFVDLVTNGATAPRYFRDSVHLNTRGKIIQRRLFQRRMKGLTRR